MISQFLMYLIIIFSLPNICYASGRTEFQKIFYVPFIIYNYYGTISALWYMFHEKEKDIKGIAFAILWLLLWTVLLMPYFL